MVTNLLNRISNYSKKISEESNLCDKLWVKIDEIQIVKIVYVFKRNGNLIISKNGEIEIANWSYLTKNAIMITDNKNSRLFKHGFLDENILILKLDGTDKFNFYANEEKFKKELNSPKDVFDFLQEKYPPEVELKQNTQKTAQKKVEVITFKELENGTFVKSYLVNGEILEIYSHLRNRLQDFDKAFINGKKAPDGIYELDWYNTIEVNNGLIKLKRRRNGRFIDS